MSKSINIKKTRGFTIVELLVVIVVIGILAAISIVSYSGVVNRAHKADALNAATGVKQSVEVYYAENAKYPATVDAFSVSSISIPKGYTVIKDLKDVGGTLTSTLDSTNGNSAVAVFCYSSETVASGKYCEDIADKIVGIGIKYWSYDGTDTSLLIVGTKNDNIGHYKD